MGASAVSVSAVSSMPTGLRNLGNTCYMNSALQCLFQAQEFNIALSHSPVSRLTASYFTLLRQEKKVRQLLKIKSEMKKADKNFGGFKQQDASEFLALFFTRLFATSPQLQDEVQELFAVKTELTATCKQCSKSARSDSVQTFLSLPLLPAQVTFVVLAGESHLPDVTVYGTEMMQADSILAQVKKATGKEAIWLVVKTPFTVTRVVTDFTENLKKLEVAIRPLYYYEVETSQCLLEVKVMAKGVVQKRFQRSLVKKVQMECSPRELSEKLEEDLRRELGVERISLLSEAQMVHCMGTRSRWNDLRQGGFGEVLKGTHPVLRVQAIIETQLPEVPNVPVTTSRSSEAVTIDSLFANFLAEEPQSENYTCSTCAQPTDHVKQTRILKLPRYLVITLQRYNSLDGSKDQRHVHFELELSIKVDETPKNYRLFAVVQHHGMAFTSGHYTSCVRFQNVWYLCNDSEIRELMADVILTQVQTDAYLLFYEDSAC